MNKFAILALFACVATALASPIEINDEPSQAVSFVTTDEEETRYMTESKKAAFGPFCIEARDEVKLIFKKKFNEGTSRAFVMVMEILQEIINSLNPEESDAVKKGVNDINGDSRKILSAFANVISNMATTGRQKLLEIYNRFKDNLNVDQLEEITQSSCNELVGSVKPSLDRKLSLYKKELIGTAKSNLSGSVRTIDELECVTTKRISKIASACNMLRIMGPNLFNYFRSN